MAQLDVLHYFSNKNAPVSILSAHSLFLMITFDAVLQKYRRKSIRKLLIATPPKGFIHSPAKHAIQSSFHLPKSLIVIFMYLSKSQEYQNGRYIATYLGGHVRSNWPRFLYIWEKAKSSSSINYRHRSIYHSLFYIERIHACNCGCCFSGATLFCEGVRQVSRAANCVFGEVRISVSKNPPASSTYPRHVRNCPPPGSA